MNLARRRFAQVTALAAASLCLPSAADAETPENTFTESDTPDERLAKFNKLTGLSLTFGSHWLSRSDPCDFGERCLMDGDKHFTGPMDEETFRHWTAQVALGYRIAKGGQ